VLSSAEEHSQPRRRGRHPQHPNINHITKERNQGTGHWEGDRGKGSRDIHEARYYRNDFYAQSNGSYDLPSKDSTPYSLKVACSVRSSV
jgi:hypothetical protein